MQEVIILKKMTESNKLWKLFKKNCVTFLQPESNVTKIFIRAATLYDKFIFTAVRKKAYFRIFQKLQNIFLWC